MTNITTRVCLWNIFFQNRVLFSYFMGIFMYHRPMLVIGIRMLISPIPYCPLFKPGEENQKIIMYTQMKNNTWCRTNKAGPTLTLQLLHKDLMVSPLAIHILVKKKAKTMKDSIILHNFLARIKVHISHLK